MRKDTIVYRYVRKGNEGEDMGFTVEQLLQAEEFSNMKLLCGMKGIRKEIRGVTIIEAPDIVKFINGGELLLTGLYAFRYCSLEEFDDYIEEIQKKKISGLVIKKGRKVEDAERKIELLREFSERYEIPLVEVPFEISFQQVMSYVMEHIFNQEVTRLKFFKTTHDNFTALSLNSVQRQYPIGDILYMLSKLIRNPVALYHQNMTCFAEAGNPPEGFTWMPDAVEYDPGIISNYQYMRQEGEYVQYIVKIRLNAGSQMYLVITEKDAQFGQMDCIAVENAIVALQYELFRKFAVLELEKKYQNDLLNNLLNGKVTSSAELKKSIALLGMDPEAYYRVLVFGMCKQEDGPTDMNEELYHLNCLEEVMKRKIPDAKVQSDLEKLVVIISADPKQMQGSCRDELKKLRDEIQEEMLFHDKEIKVKAGIGKMVKGIANLQESYKEAEDAFSFIDISGDISEEGTSYFMMFSDLGIFKLLSQLNDPALLLEYVPESLQKLYNYKKPQQEDLLTTLKTYLNCNQNLSKTAQSLYVHYKTAVYRIEKIAKITGMDFNNANEMLSVRIGLVVYKMIEGHHKNK